VSETFSEVSALARPASGGAGSAEGCVTGLAATPSMWRGGRLSPAHRAMAGQFLRFGAVGVFGFVVDTAVVYAARHWLGLLGAGVLSFFVAASANWFLNRVWTFRGQHSGRMHHQWIRFIGCNLIGFVLNRGTFAILISLFPICVHYPVLAVAAGSIAGLSVNFTLSRRVVYR
jgi:putative flippase GtrA